MYPEHRLTIAGHATARDRNTTCPSGTLQQVNERRAWTTITQRRQVELPAWRWGIPVLEGSEGLPPRSVQLQLIKGLDWQDARA